MIPKADLQLFFKISLSLFYLLLKLDAPEFGYEMRVELA